jgi:hypothetical protein
MIVASRARNAVGWVACLCIISSVAIAGSAAAKPDDHRVRGDQGLRISAAVPNERVSASDPINVTVILKNVSDAPIAVLSHIATHETHLDWYRFQLAYLAPDGKGRCDPKHARHATRDIAIADARDKSIPIVQTLAPGASVTHTVDLQAWANRRINGATRIPPGAYQVSVAYKVTAKDGGFIGEQEKVWRGALESPPVPVTVTGQPTRDSCTSASPG